MTQSNSGFLQSGWQRWLGRALLFCLPWFLLLFIEALLAMFALKPAPRFFVADPAEVLLPAKSSPWGDAGSIFGEARIVMPKPVSVRRLFIVGASTVRGFPLDPHLAFGDWLRAGLEIADPQQSYEVIICGENGKNANAVADLAVELCQYQADALLVYTGHNELHVGNWSEIKEPQVRKARELLQQTRLGRCFLPNNTFRPVRAGEPVDFPVLSQTVQVTSEHIEEARRLHQSSLERIAKAANETSVPLLISKLISNLVDYPPAGSVLMQDEQGEQALAQERIALQILYRDRFALDPESSEWFDEGCVLSVAVDEFSDPALNQARSALRMALELSPKTARFHYVLGRVELGLGEIEAARSAFVAAAEFDLYPMRAVPTIQRSVEVVCHETGAYLVNPEPLFVTESPTGLIGAETILDYVHPNLKGQYLLAQAFFEGLQQLDMFAGSLENAAFPSFEQCRDKLHLTQKSSVMATRLSELGWLSLTGFANRGIESRPSVRRCFDLALQFDDQLGSALTGKDLLLYLCEPSQQHRQSLLKSLADSGHVAPLLLLSRADDEWQRAVEPLLLSLKKNGE